MTDVTSDTPETRESPDLPPSYEQSLAHRRVERGYGIPGYSLDDTPADLAGGAYPGPPRSRPSNNRSRHVPHASAPRNFRLPNTDLTGTATPVVVRDDESVSSASSDDEQTKTCLKLALPPMHMCMAVTCLIFNIITPGIGTMLAGWAIFCCTKTDKWVVKEKVLGCGLNFVLGLLQLILVPAMLLGWIWSVIWGFALLGVSLDDYHGMKDDNDEDASPDRPRSTLFRRIPPPSVTRQAMRQSTSRVSVDPTTSRASVDPTTSRASVVHGTHSSRDQTTVNMNPTNPGTAVPGGSGIARVHPDARQSHNSHSGSRQSSSHQGASRPGSRDSRRSSIERQTPGQSGTELHTATTESTISQPTPTCNDSQSSREHSNSSSVTAEVHTSGQSVTNITRSTDDHATQPSEYTSAHGTSSLSTEEYDTGHDERPMTGCNSHTTQSNGQGLATGLPATPRSLPVLSDVSM